MCLWPHLLGKAGKDENLEFTSTTLPYQFFLISKDEFRSLEGFGITIFYFLLMKVIYLNKREPVNVELFC